VQEPFRCTGCGAPSAAATRCASCGGGAFELARSHVRPDVPEREAELVSLQAVRAERDRRAGANRD
jgi:hypothetical protein